MRQSEWEKEKAIHILELVRSELYMDMPHFLTALNGNPQLDRVD